MEAIKEARSFLETQNIDTSQGRMDSSGLWYVDIVEGSGRSPSTTDEVEVHYQGWLVDGTKFDSSVDRGQSIVFPLDAVISGWTAGVCTMKAGGKRVLIIPPDLGYGENGAPPVIPQTRHWCSKSSCWLSLNRSSLIKTPRENRHGIL